MKYPIIKRRSVYRMALYLYMIFQLTLPLYGREYSKGTRKSLTPEELKSRIVGPILSMPTFFTSSLDIDFDAASTVIENALKYECKVVTLTAGDSQYSRMTYQEIKNLTSQMATMVSKDVVFLAATGIKWPLEQVIDYARFSEAVGADGLLVYYDSQNIKEDLVVDFIRQVADNTSLGIILHGNFSESLLDRLIKIDSIIGLKEDVGLRYLIDRVVKYSDRLVIYPGGTDERYIPAYPYGSPAYFSSLYTYAPQVGLELWQAFQKDEIKKAGDLIKKYDYPFLKRFSNKFWYATIDYFNGTNTYLRKSDNRIEPEDKMTDEELREMEQFYKDQGFVPSRYSSCAITNGPELPRSRGGQAGGIVKECVVITSGNDWSPDKTQKYWLDETLIYKDNKWQQGPALPHPAAYMMYAHDESGLYIVGGTDGTIKYRQVYRLSDHQSWEQLADLPVHTDSGAAAILNGKLYVVGGNTTNGDNNQMYVLDIRQKTSTWEKCEPLPGTERQFPALAACNGYLYLMGGLVAPFEPQKDAYRYDPKFNQWQQLSDLPIEGYCWTAKPVNDTHLILTGMANKKGISNGIWLVDLNDMSLKKIGSTAKSTCTGSIVPVGENQWWAIGGEPNSSCTRLSEVYLVRLR